MLFESFRMVPIKLWINRSCFLASLDVLVEGTLSALVRHFLMSSWIAWPATESPLEGFRDELKKSSMSSTRQSEGRLPRNTRDISRATLTLRHVEMTMAKAKVKVQEHPWHL